MTTWALVPTIFEQIIGNLPMTDSTKISTDPATPAAPSA
jgi:hypothetical protein